MRSKSIYVYEMLSDRLRLVAQKFVHRLGRHTEHPRVRLATVQKLVYDDIGLILGLTGNNTQIGQHPLLGFGEHGYARIVEIDMIPVVLKSRLDILGVGLVVCRFGHGADIYVDKLTLMFIHETEAIFGKLGTRLHLQLVVKAHAVFHIYTA